MTCLGCQRCETGPMVTLISGEQVCSYCPSYRVECEARNVVSIPHLSNRQFYMKEIRRVRGANGYLELAEAVKKVWAHNREHVSNATTEHD